jgi:hypothetical protein
LAGLPFTRYKPHSLYVTYYEVGGVGLDATIFPNAQDLSFVNDTSGPIVIHSHIDGDDAFVDFYGIPDGRTVALDGPYFNGSEWAPSLLPELRTNEIGWVRQIVAADGTVEQEPFVSRYSKGIPRLRLLKDVASGQQHMYLHASAGVTQ